MTRKIDVTVFIALVVIGIAIVFSLGQDGNWDLANYHYYSVYALLNGRIGFDIVPSGIQSYFNPIADVPFYFLAKTFNNFPHFVMAMQSLYWSLCVFFVYLISKNIFKFDTKFGKFLTAFSTVIGGSGIISVVEAGSTFNDLTIAFAALVVIFILTKNVFVKETKNLSLTLALCGAILGVATGLKPSGLIFSIGIFAGLIFFRKKINAKSFGIMVLSFFAGYILTYGWWGYILWSKFGNPYFPYLNNFFQSPYGFVQSYADMRHLPDNVLQALFYPVYWLLPEFNQKCIEFANRDFRFVSMFFASLLVLVSYGFLKKPETVEKIESVANFGALKFLYLFLIVGYIFWLNTSSILRYMVTYELLSGLYLSIIPILVAVYCKKSVSAVVATVFALLVLSSTQYPSTWYTRTYYRDRAIWCEDLKLPDNAVVCMLGGFPSQVFIPFQNPKAQFIYIHGEIGYPFLHNDFMKKKIDGIINDPEKEVFLIYSICEPAPVDWDVVSKYINIDNYTCETVKSTFEIPEYKFCRLKKNK